MSSAQLLLGFDSATPTTTVGVVEADLTHGYCRPLVGASHRDPRRHGEVLPVLIARVLAEAGYQADDLTAVAVGIGPGAYTGLRVAIATAQALGLSLGIPVYGAVTLDAIAIGTGLTDRFAVATDARRREVFLATYADCATRQGDPQVAAPDRAAQILASVPVFVDADTPSLPGVDVTVVDGVTGTSVCEVVVDRLQRGEQPDSPRPMYLRRPDVTVSAGPKSVLR